MHMSERYEYRLVKYFEVWSGQDRDLRLVKLCRVFFKNGKPDSFVGYVPWDKHFRDSSVKSISCDLDAMRTALDKPPLSYPEDFL